MMAIAFRSSTNFSGGSSTSFTINVPTGVTTGDGLLLAVDTNPTSQGWGTVSTPSGWTAVTSADPLLGGTGSALYVFTRSASSEPASYTVTISAANPDVAAVMVAYSGCSTTALVNTSGTASGGGVTSVTAPSLTGVNTTDMVIIAAGGRPDASGTPTITIPSPWTTRQSNVADAGSFPAVLTVGDDLDGTGTPSIAYSATCEANVCSVAFAAAPQLASPRAINVIGQAVMSQWV